MCSELDNVPSRNALLFLCKLFTSVGSSTWCLFLWKFMVSAMIILLLFEVFWSINNHLTASDWRTRFSKLSHLHKRLPMFVLGNTMMLEWASRATKDTCLRFSHVIFYAVRFPYRWLVASARQAKEKKPCVTVHLGLEVELCLLANAIAF